MWMCKSAERLIFNCVFHQCVAGLLCRWQNGVIDDGDKRCVEKTKDSIHPRCPLSHRWRQKFVQVAVLLDALAILLPWNDLSVALLAWLKQLNGTVRVCTKQESFGLKQKSAWMQRFRHSREAFTGPVVFKKNLVMCDWPWGREGYKHCCHPWRLRNNCYQFYP